MWADEEEEEDIWPARARKDVREEVVVDEDEEWEEDEAPAAPRWQPPAVEERPFDLLCPSNLEFAQPEMAAPPRPPIPAAAPSSRPLIDLSSPGEGEDDWPPPRRAGYHGGMGEPGRARTSAPPSWHLPLALVVGGVAWLGRHVPDEASLGAFLEGRYGHEPPAKTGRLILPDRSHSSLPYNTTWHDGWVAALGRTAVRDKGRHYEHHYLGLGGHWLPLPYLPRVHLKGKGKEGSFKYGAGLCYGGRCVCIPQKNAPCLKVTFDASSLLSVMMVLNGGLFVAGLMWPPDRFPLGKLNTYFTLTPHGLWQGQLLPLLTSSFFHVGIFETGRCIGMLATVFEDCAEQGVLLFLVLYVGGSVAHFLGAVAAIRFGGPRWLLFTEMGRGCRGGLSSLLALLSKTNSDRRFNISLYMVQIPTPLSPLATIAANAALDAAFASSRGRAHAEIAGHVMAALWGRALAEMFT